MINSNLNLITILRLAASISVLTVFATPPLQAQDSPPPFSKIHIALEAGSKFGQSSLDPYWATGTPAALALRLPFYFGMIEGGLQQLGFQAPDNLLPDFQSQFIFLGWGLQRRVWDNLSLGLGLRLGNQFMTFEGAKEYAQHESELGTEVYGTLGYHLIPNWMIGISFRHQRIYTRHLIQLQFMTVSVTRELETPLWLRDILE